jgi:release factor glutamine methyltransferase
MTPTVGDVLEVASLKLRSHSDSPIADAQLLLRETLGRSRAWILAHPEHELSGDQLAEFEGSLAELLDGAALPYVLGWWEFYGRRFHLGPQVLIPRPETELLVEQAISRSVLTPRILDIGTGSGCIAVTLALEIPDSSIYASDLSWRALQVARRNIEAHGVEQTVTLVNSNLVEAFAGPFDLVCANLPYVAADQLHRLEVARKEPRMALDGGSFGTELIYEVLARLPGILAQSGCALFEIDPDQAAGVVGQARSRFPTERLRIEKDLAGRDRLLVVERD